MTDSSRFLSGLAAAEKSFTATISNLKYLAAGFTALTTVAFGKIAADFDEAMANTMATMRETSPEVRRAMEDSLLNLSAQSITTPLQLAHGYEELARRGYDAARAMSALVPIERFAVLGRMDMEHATSNLLRIQMGLGLATDNAAKNAERLQYIGDVVTSVGYRAGGSMRAFAHGVAHLAPFLRFNNVTLEEGVALLAMFTSQNYDAAHASQAAMHFLQVIQRLPILSEHGPHARTIRTGSYASAPLPPFGVHPLTGPRGRGQERVNLWGRLGLNVHDAAGRMRPIADTLEELERVIMPMEARERQRTFMELGFDRLIGRIAIPHMGLSQAFRVFLDQAMRSRGMMEVMYSDRLVSFNAQTTLLANNFRILSIEMGRIFLPALLSVNTALRAGFDWWRGLSTNVRVTVMLTTLATTAFMLLRTAIPYLSLAVIHLTARLMPLVLIFSPLIGLLFQSHSWWNALPTAITRTVIALFSFISVITIMRMVIPAITVLYTALWATMGSALLPSIIAGYRVLIATLLVIKTVLAAIFLTFTYSNANAAITAIGSTVISILKAFVVAIPALIVLMSQLRMASIMGAISSFVGFFGSIMTAISSILLFVTQFAVVLLIAAPVLAIIVMLLAVMSDMIPEISNPFRDMVMDWEAIGNAIMVVIGFLYNFRENFNNIANVVSRNFRTMFVDAAAFVAVLIRNLVAILTSEIEYFGKYINLQIQLALPHTPAVTRRLEEELRVLTFIQEHARRMGYTGSAVRMEVQALPRMLSDWSGFSINTLMPQNIAASIRSLPGQIMRMFGAGEGGMGHEIPGRSVDFKEMSLRRFLLDRTEVSRDTAQVVTAPALEGLAEQGLDLLRRMLGLPSEPVTGR